MSERGRALIVYETMFGNTERIARAIRDAWRSSSSRTSSLAAAPRRRSWSYSPRMYCSPMGGI